MKTSTAQRWRLLAPLGMLLVPLPPCSAEVWFGEPIVTDSPFDLTLPKLADLDNDGLLDMVARRDQGNSDILLVYLGDESGHMSVTDTIPYNGGITDFVFIDENRDGFQDIIVGGGSRIYRNDGAAHFSLAGNYNTPYAWFFSGDIDKDGVEDLAGWFSQSWVKIIWGTPQGMNWQNPQYVRMHYDYGFFGGVLRFVDLDADGFNDVIAAGAVSEPTYGAAIHWCMGTGPRSFSPRYVYETGNADDAFIDLDCADLDGDGDLDLVCPSGIVSEIESTVFIYDSYRNLLTPAGNPFNEQKLTTKLERLDSDDLYDAVTQVLTEPNGCKTIVYRGLGAGAFLAVQELPGARDVALGHLGGDDGIDILSTPAFNEGPPIGVWPNLAFDPTGISDGPVLDGPALCVEPNVATERVRITSCGPKEMNRVLVLDLQGRLVRSFTDVSGEVTWDLRNGAGLRVAPGAYWVRGVGPKGTATRRVTVLR